MRPSSVPVMVKVSRVPTDAVAVAMPWRPWSTIVQAGVGLGFGEPFAQNGQGSVGFAGQRAVTVPQRRHWQSTGDAASALETASEAVYRHHPGSRVVRMISHMERITPGAPD